MLCKFELVQNLHMFDVVEDEVFWVSRLRSAFPELPARQLGLQPWPTYNPEFLVENTKEIVIQVNGKLRDKVVLPADASRDALESAALASPRVAEYTEGKTIRKVIVVPGRLVNIVAN